ncbi:hypothetical protein ACFW1A_24120 [Kitasatospora sp. NPDC058965]|uniref:hypothetical protein n=1 Tax=Kitasatospora sp. NPDC058965 TaxID=3346682 RepID=UPI0036A78E1A
MHRTSDTPWSVTLDYSRDLALALAVREAVGCADPLGLPPVDPPVAVSVLPAERRDPTLTQQWHAWWTGAMAAPGHGSRPAPQVDGPLGAVLRRNSDVLLPWSAARKRELAASSRAVPGRPRIRLADALREAGVRDREFHLTVLAAPVGLPVFHPVGGSVILAGLELVRDRSAYVTALVDHLTGYGPA